MQGLPRDLSRLIRSFANDPHVFSNRDVFLTAVQSLSKVSPFVPVDFRGSHTAAVEKEILYLRGLGALVPKDGVVYHNYRCVRNELWFGMEHFVWRPRSVAFLAKSWRTVEFPYV